MSNPPPSGPPQGGTPDQPYGGQSGQPGESGRYGGQLPGQPAYGPPPQQWGAAGPGAPAGPAVPPTWGPPDPSEPPAGSTTSSRLPFILAGVVVVVLLVVLGVVLVLNGSGSGSGSPKDTAQDFVAAAKARDCEKALSLISDDLKEEQSPDCGSDNGLVPSESQDVSFGEVKISNETDTKATATVDATFQGRTITITLGLVKQDDEWKIDSFK